MAPVESGGVGALTLPSVTLSPAVMPGLLSELKTATAGLSGEDTLLVRGRVATLPGVDVPDRDPPRKTGALWAAPVPSEGNWLTRVSVKGGGWGCGSERARAADACPGAGADGGAA